MHSVTLRFPDALTLRFPDSKFVTFVNPHISTNPNVQAQKMEDAGPSYVQAQQKEKLAGNADQAEEDWGSWKGSTGSGSAPAPAPADVASAAADVGSGAVEAAELADIFWLTNFFGLTVFGSQTVPGLGSKKKLLPFVKTNRSSFFCSGAVFLHFCSGAVLFVHFCLGAVFLAYFSTLHILLSFCLQKCVFV